MSDSSASLFPLEIEEAVVDILAEDKDLSSVKACSLVCRAFLPLCRKHIFASIVLNDRNAISPSPTTRMFEQLLSITPEIADYIRKLDYNIALEDLSSPSLLGCLKRISRLQSLSIWHYNMPKLDWRSNRLRPALLHLLHLPTLTHFKVFAVDNFVVSDLTTCVSLKKLEIGNNTTVAVEDASSVSSLDHSIRLHEFVVGIRSATATMGICTAQRSDGQPLVNFSSLANITVALEKRNDIEASQELFRRCEQLVDVHLSFWNPRSIWPGIANMLRPSMQTLRHLDVVIHVENADDDPLFNLPSELEDMRNNNVIEDITIAILVETDESCKEGDEWGALDKVLSRSGWPALKQVSLAIRLASYSRTDNELEVALKRLPETQFPRLSATYELALIGRIEDYMIDDSNQQLEDRRAKMTK